MESSRLGLGRSSLSRLGVLCRLYRRVDLLPVLEADTGRRGTVSPAGARADTDDVRVDRAGDAVGDFDVELGDRVLCGITLGFGWWKSGE